MSATKFLLDEESIPTHWVNLLPDLPGEPLPPLSPQTGQPAGPDDLTPIFPMGLIVTLVSAGILRKRQTPGIRPAASVAA